MIPSAKRAGKETQYKHEGLCFPKTLIAGRLNEFVCDDMRLPGLEGATIDTYIHVCIYAYTDSVYALSDLPGDSIALPRRKVRRR